MNCKRCGALLPLQGYVCSHCGMLMNSEQIKMQKTLLKMDDKNVHPELISEKYGGKKQIFQGRDERTNKSKAFLVLFGVLFFIIFMAIVVYFF